MSALEALRSLHGVRRAWPERGKTLTFELVDDSGLLRAGRIDHTGQVELAEVACDSRLPDLSPELPGRLVVHRLGRRAVLVGTDYVTKLLRPGRASRTVHSSRELAGLCAAAGLGAALVLDHSATRIEFSKLAGLTLHDLGTFGVGGWQRFVDVWPRFVTQQWVGPQHTGLDEAAVLRRWFDQVVEFDALAPLDRLRSATEETCAALAAPATRLVVAHRDLHDKQLLWDGQSLSMLDLDTACLAEPELDLANLWTHVELRHVQGSIDSATATQILALLNTLSSRLNISEERFAVYRRATRLRLAFVYAFRPSASSWLPDWTASC